MLKNRSVRRALATAFLGITIVATTTSSIGASQPSAPFTSTDQIQNQINSIQQTLANGKTISYANLGAAIAAAPNDHPSQTCLASYADVSPFKGYCVWGSTKSNAKLVVALGDSHMWQWLAALDALGRQRNWKIVSYTKASCPFLAAIYTISSTQNAPSSMWNQPYSQCQSWRNAVLGSVAQLKPYLIVTSSEFRPESLYTWPARNAIAIGTAQTQMLSTLKSYVGNNAARVIALLDTPYEGVYMSSTADCLSRNPALVPNPNPNQPWPHNFEYCYRPWTTYDYSSPKVRDEIATAVTSAGVTVIDPSTWFCSVSKTGICPPIISGIVTYFDNAHIASSYSLLLVNLLGAHFPSA